MSAGWLGVNSTRDLMVLLLSVAGGGVDAIIILGFGVLTAAQTGNTILLAVSLAQGRFAAGVLSAVSVVGYVIGTIVGEIVISRRQQDASRLSSLSWSLLGELVPLGSLLIAWHFVGSSSNMLPNALLIALAAIAMGIQSAAVLYIDAGPTTTYVTGMLTTFVTKTVHTLYGDENAPHTPPPNTPTWFYGLGWLLYIGGAFVSALFFLWLHQVALLLPIAAIVTVIVIQVRSHPRT